MKALTTLRWSRAPWLALLAVGGTVLFIAGTRFPHSYTADVFSRIDFTLRALAPLTAAGAAYLTAEIAEYVSRHRAGRSWWAGVLRAVWPAVAIPAVVYSSALAWGLIVKAGALPSPATWAMAGLNLAALVTWGLVGVLVGSTGQRLAAPVLAVAVHLFYAFLPAMTTPWLRQLPGVQTGCCATDTAPGWGFMATGALFYGLLAAGCVAAGLLSARRWAGLLASLAFAGGAASALAINSTGSDEYVMSVPRTDPLVCQEGHPTVCLWPEHQDRLPQVSQALAQAQQTLTEHGAPALSDRISEHEGDGAGPLGYRRDLSEAPMVTNAAYISLAQQAGREKCGKTDLRSAAVAMALAAGHELKDIYPYEKPPQSMRELSRQPVDQLIARAQRDLLTVAECAR